MIKYTEAITKRVRLRDAIPLRTPFTLHIDPTNVCNWGRRSMRRMMRSSTCRADGGDAQGLNIWNGERLKHIRRLHLMGRRAEIPSCRNCQVLQGSRNQTVDSLDEVPPSILD